MGKFYIATSIAYVNAKPHIGYAMEVIQADVLARYHRLKGDDTFYQTGTDEHGIKNVQTAEAQGITPQDLADMNSGFFRELKDRLNLSYDYFIRTTDESHKRGAQKMWTKMMEKGDIYKGSYEGLYCVGCEAFVLEKDLVDGNCVNHNKPPEKLKEENYFFRLSKYADKIKYAIEVNEIKILPQSKKNEVLSLINEGLKDVSFSRQRAVLKWGVPVPNDPDQTMYVWCDALSNYITGIGYEKETEQFKKFWPADVQLIGKDILRFHAAIWIGMLMSAGVHPPKAIYVHGFITSEGKKMSKSLNNVVDPAEYVDKYGVDALRYYLLKEIPTMDDGDFSKERFNVVYESELANNIGNLVSRVLAMTVKYFDGKVPAAEKSEGVFKTDTADMWKHYQEAIDEFDLKRALEIVVELGMRANKFVDDTKPWVLAKDNQEELARVLYALLEMIRHLALMLAPFLPATAEKILGFLGQEIVGANGVLGGANGAAGAEGGGAGANGAAGGAAVASGAEFKDLIKWGALKEGTVVQKADPLFARIAE